RSAGEPVWPHPSPDGTWVRYLTYPDQPDGTGVLWTQEVATGRRVEIGRGFGFAWRPARPAGAPEVEVAPSGDKPCPIDPEACDFAAQVSRWVLSGNADAIVAATTPEVFRCPQPGPAIGGEFLPCVNAVPGEQRFGYTLRLLGSHGYVADREDYRTRLLNSLVGPAGQPQTAEFRLATLGCPLEGAGVSCRDAFAMVFGQRGPLEAPDRSFLIFLARRGPDGRLTLAPPTIFAPSIPGEDGRALAEGGTIAPPYLEDPVPFGTFHPWTPPEPTSASQRPLPSQPSPADQLEEGLVRFLASLHYHLRMATGEGVACDYRCLPGGSFPGLIDDIRQRDCTKGDPTGVLRSEGYDEARHGELAGAYVAACQLILAPPAWAGALRDSPEWRAVANQAEAMVWEVLRRRAALVVNTGDCLNVRAAASTAAEVQECLIDGTLVWHSGEVTRNQEGSWLRVRTPNGIEGWASTEYLAY
ncbi:MAG TPA: SH3 domain-containing protein, partial [Dehalococcoidia bacterium]